MSDSTATDKQVTCYDIDGQPMEFLASQLSWRPSAYGLIIEDGRVLLCRVKNKDWDGYVVPGGAVEIHETVEAAVRREVFEETNLTVEVVQLLGCYSSFFFMPYSNKPCNALMTYWLCRPVSGSPSSDNLETIEQGFMQAPEWVDVARLPDIRLYDSSGQAKGIIQKYVERQSDRS